MKACWKLSRDVFGQVWQDLSLCFVPKHAHLHSSSPCRPTKALPSGRMLYKQGKSIRDIAGILKKGEKFVRGVLPLALCMLFWCAFPTGVVDKLKLGVDPLKSARGSGRPRKTTKRDDRAIVKLIRKKPFSSLPTLIKDGEILKLSRWTVTRRLKEVFTVGQFVNPILNAFILHRLESSPSRL